MSERRYVNAAAVVCLLLAMLLVTVYLGGYFAFSTKHSGATADDFCRIFRSPWLTAIYKPAAKVESAVTGDEICTYTSLPLPSNPPMQLCDPELTFSAA